MTSRMMAAVADILCIKYVSDVKLGTYQRGISGQNDGDYTLHSQVFSSEGKRHYRELNTIPLNVANGTYGVMQLMVIPAHGRYEEVLAELKGTCKRKNDNNRSHNHSGIDAVRGIVGDANYGMPADAVRGIVGDANYGMPADAAHGVSGDADYGMPADANQEGADDCDNELTISSDITVYLDHPDLMISYHSHNLNDLVGIGAERVLAQEISGLPNISPGYHYHGRTENRFNLLLVSCKGDFGLRVRVESVPAEADGLEGILAPPAYQRYFRSL
ncbi:hypothetical protein JXB31_00695 [Candidatus Woesearchaeota archaeon]|nr:hypothetical protein [Candidatus Woesearchaeota archaeon]